VSSGEQLRHPSSCFGVGLSDELFVAFLSGAAGHPFFSMALIKTAGKHYATASRKTCCARQIRPAVI